MRRQLMIVRHDLGALLFSRGWAARLVLTSMSVGLLAFPLFRDGGWKHGLAFTVLWLVVALWKTVRELSPRNMQIVERNYVERKLRLFKLILELSRRETLSEAQVEEYQHSVLELIANYVRDHRADRRSTTIFANLLVEKDGRMHVVARDKPHRQRSEPLRNEFSVAHLAVQTGNPQVTGDVYADYPETMPGKPYLSILAIPVVNQDRVLGVVSIDSSRRYQFDSSAEDLTKYLMPYVALLVWTLDPQRTKNRQGEHR